MTILWRDNLSVDRGFIDKDHKRLIDLINTIESIVVENRGVGELQGGLVELHDYTRDHFAREEDFMFSRRYAKFDDHKAKHRRLVAQLVDVAKPIHAVDRRDASVADGIEQVHLVRLIELLRLWLLDHIIQEDLRLKPLIA